jgi:hypothetical protein
MEKSHHIAKAATQSHTQHGGTSARSSIILQQYQHWYRNIQHRYARKAEKELANSQLPQPELATNEAAERRREAWISSTAAASHQAWRDRRVREGRRSVGRDALGGDTSESVEEEITNLVTKQVAHIA